MHDMLANILVKRKRSKASTDAVAQPWSHLSLHVTPHDMLHTEHAQHTQDPAAMSDRYHMFGFNRYYDSCVEVMDTAAAHPAAGGWLRLGMQHGCSGKRRNNQRQLC
jgi:hypothetical protein